MLPVRLNKSIMRLALYCAGLFIILFILNNQPVAVLHKQALRYVPHEATDDVLTGISLKTCYFFSTCSLGPEWRMVPKQLDWNKDTGKKWSFFTQQYLFVKSVPLTEIMGNDAVTKLTVKPDGSVVHEIEKFDPNRSNRFYYGLDVIFSSPIDPRHDWTIHATPISGIQGNVPVFITTKNSPGADQNGQPSLRVKDDGKFKILQVADLHFSSFEGICRDQFPEVPNCKADSRTLTFVNKVLDIEKPDLVVLTGDQIFGEDSFDSITTTLKYVQPFIERRIPYAITFGNHDDEGSMSREELMAFMKTLPFNVASEGPSDIDGVGNYILHVFSNNGPLINLYMLDSHKYSLSPKIPGYDWVKENQLEWLKKNKPDAPTGDVNPINMAFFHIPLPEYRNVQGGIVGNAKEGITAPKYNTGTRDVLQSLGISVVSVGHDHCNDYCTMDVKDGSQDDKIWLCYGGGSGEGGYGGYGGTTRRLRVFEMSTNEGVVKSWKRLETTPDEVFDVQTLVSGGKPIKE
ncbi:Phosphatase DCR2 [Cyberlindnera fabianii]|uniref:Phosphatase DCR2 n=1 Tax=Cyberlindnera fabianii TaxID=36022 RepID=A0A1V2L8X9_CYBFA|nr:Phosphatase DCR2 [Cyberlindnera fabianii]